MNRNDVPCSPFRAPCSLSPHTAFRVPRSLSPRSFFRAPHSLFLRFPLFLVLLLLIIGLSSALADGPDVWISPDGALTADAITFTKADNGKYYLYLPGNLDTEHCCFGVADGVSFTFKNKAVQTGDSAAGLKSGDFSVKLGKKSFTLHVLRGSEGLPAVYITTESGKLKTIEASKKNKEPGALVFRDPSGEVQYDGALEHIKARGNSSMTFAKKNYQFKLKTGANLMGMGKAKKWILSGNYRDKSHLRNQVMMDLAAAVGLPYTPEHIHAELYINHEYHGLYLLSEKIEIDRDRVAIANLEKATENANETPLDSFKLVGKKKSTKGAYKAYEIPEDPADITGGYLIEYESYPTRYKDEASAYTSKKGFILVMKSPEYASRAQMDYITSLLQSFENAIYAADGKDPATGKHFFEIADADSLALKYMMEEFSENYDGNTSSQYFFKPSDDVSPLLFAGPVWDYDSSFGTYAQKHNAKKVLNPAFLWIAEGDRSGWYPALYRQADFRQKVAELWTGRVREAVGILLGERKDEASGLRSLDEYAAAISASVEMDRKRWPRNSTPSASATAWTGDSFDANIRFLKDYIRKRTDYLDTVWTVE